MESEESAHVYGENVAAEPPAEVSPEQAEEPAVEQEPATAADSSSQPGEESSAAAAEMSHDEAPASGVAVEPQPVERGAAAAADPADTEVAATTEAATDNGEAVAAEHSEHHLQDEQHDAVTSLSDADTSPANPAEVAPVDPAPAEAGKTAEALNTELAAKAAAAAQPPVRPASSNTAPAAYAAAEPAVVQPTAPEPTQAAHKQPEAAAAEATEPTTTSKASKPHKETTVERLTTPTAMRMLKTLQKTQGDKVEWHIASGVVFKSKKLDADEMSAMVDRLCVAKHAEDDMPPKPHAVKLVYEDNREAYVPVKEVSKEENIAYMAELYSRCQETRAKTQQTLADKYLQPLIKPKPKKAA